MGFRSETTRIAAQPHSGKMFLSRLTMTLTERDLIKIEPYPQTVPPGNLLESENVIDADRGGDAFEKLLLEGNTAQLNFDGSEYAGGTSADTGKRMTTVETPPGPICPIGLTYDPDSGLCADADFFETAQPTCPDGWTVGRSQSRLRDDMRGER